MSSASSFKSLVYYGSQGLSIFSNGTKGWKLEKELDFEDAVPAKIQKLLGKSVLVLVSDSYAGHLQLLLPNKKAELTDENIAQILEKDYEIETDSYEFASQKFTLSREQVQLSISGIESDVYQKIQEWLTPFSSKKAWLMPFGWFLSPLKSVEPVLLATALSDDQILISHHYLGVDDAREVKEKDLVAYVKSRKNERKETHLLYLQAEDALQKAITEKIGDIVAIHPLVEKPDVPGVLESVITAVWEKGEEALAELLHFEMDLAAEGSAAAEVLDAEETVVTAQEEAEDEVSAEDQADAEEVKENDEEADMEDPTKEDLAGDLSASDLPKPTLPAMTPGVAATVVESEVSVEEEVSAESDATDSDDSDNSTEEDTPEEVEEAEPTTTTVKKKQEIVAKQVTETVIQTEDGDDDDDDSDTTKIKTETETETIDERSAFADFGSSGMARSSESRYREVPQKSSWKLATGVFLVVVILTSLIGGAVFWSQQTMEPKQALLPATSPTPTPIVEAEPEATPSAETAGVLSADEKAELSVLVLNAVGTPGLAGKTESELEDNDWTDIAVGNASGSYDDAVFVYTDNDAVIPTLESDLDIKLTRATEISESGSSDYDVVLIIADEVPWQ